MPYLHFSRFSSQNKILLPSGKTQDLHGSRVMTPALGLRDLGMARSVCGLLTDAICRVSGPCACFFGDFYSRHRLQKPIVLRIIQKRHSRGSGVPGCDLARQPVLEVSMPYPQFCAIPRSLASHSTPFSSHAIKAVFLCAFAVGAA